MGVRLAAISVAAAAACAVAWRLASPPVPGSLGGGQEDVQAPVAADAPPPADPLLSEIHQAISELNRPQLFALARSRGLRPEALFDLTAEQLAGEIDRLSRSRAGGAA
jgi:hypothetical protein